MNGGRVTSSVRALGGQRFIASFTPHETGTHTVQITFNGEIVPGMFALMQYFVSILVNVKQKSISFFLESNVPLIFHCIYQIIY